MGDVRYDDVEEAVAAFNAEMNEAGVDATLVMERVGMTASLVSLSPGGGRFEVGSNLTARGVMATLEMMRRVTRHAAGSQTPIAGLDTTPPIP